MVRTTLASISLLVASAACSHPDAKPTGPTKVDVVASPEQTAAAAKDLLGFLPADSEIVAGFDAAQLRQSALWKKFAPVLAGKMAAIKVGADCGFDPIETIQKLSFGMKDLTGQPQGVIVAHGFDRAAVMGCITKLNMPDKITVDHDIITINTGTSNNVAMEFVDPTTMVVFVGPAAASQGLQAAVQAGTPLRTSPAFVEMLGNVNTGESVWGLINGNSKLFDATGIHPKAVFGSVLTTSGLALHAHVKMPTPDEAKSLSSMLDGQAGQARGLVQTLDIAAKGDDVSVSVAMTQVQLESLLALAGGAF